VSDDSYMRQLHWSAVGLVKYCTCFGEVHCPPSGVFQHCIHAIGICHVSSVGCLMAWSGWNYSSDLTTPADSQQN
jgi:hypothetical protein